MKMVEARARCLVGCLMGVLLATIAGCGAGDGRQRYPIEGVVLLDSRPLSEGTILFYPVSGDHDADVGMIEQGKFAFAATAGVKRVEIEATTLSDKTAPSALGGDPARVRVSLIPARYNRDSGLTAEVIPGGENKFRFELTSDE